MQLRFILLVHLNKNRYSGLSLQGMSMNQRYRGHYSSYNLSMEVLNSCKIRLGSSKLKKYQEKCSSK